MLSFLRLSVYLLAFSEANRRCGESRNGKCEESCGVQHKFFRDAGVQSANLGQPSRETCKSPGQLLALSTRMISLDPKSIGYCERRVSERYLAVKRECPDQLRNAVKEGQGLTVSIQRDLVVQAKEGFGRLGESLEKKRGQAATGEERPLSSKSLAALFALAGIDQAPPQQSSAPAP